MSSLKRPLFLGCLATIALSALLILRESRSSSERSAGPTNSSSDLLGQSFDSYDKIPISLAKRETVRVESYAGTSETVPVRVVNISSRAPTAMELRRALSGWNKLLPGINAEIARRSSLTGLENQYALDGLYITLYSTLGAIATVTSGGAFVCGQNVALKNVAGKWYYANIGVRTEDNGVVQVTCALDLSQHTQLAGFLRQREEMDEYLATDYLLGWNALPYSERKARIDDAAQARTELRALTGKYNLVNQDTPEPERRTSQELRDLQAQINACNDRLNAIPSRVNRQTLEARGSSAGQDREEMVRRQLNSLRGN